MKARDPQDDVIAVLREGLPKVLPDYLKTRRWFGGKAREIRAIEVRDVVPVRAGKLQAYFVIAEVRYAAGPAEQYDLLLTPDSSAAGADAGVPPLRIPVQQSSYEMVLQDALMEERFQTWLLDALARGESCHGQNGEIRWIPSAALKQLWQPSQGALMPSLMKVEQSNSSIIYGKRLVLKVFRRLEPGINPDLEIGTFLTEKTSFRNSPPVAGRIEYAGKGGACTALGIFQGFVVNRGDAWRYSLDSLAEFYERVQQGGVVAPDAPDGTVLELSAAEAPSSPRERIGAYWDSAALLGKRTGELHLALASGEEADLKPEAFNDQAKRDLIHSATGLLNSTMKLIRQKLTQLDGEMRRDADEVLAAEHQLQRQLQLLANHKLSATRMRIHGDYHLGQVLYTGTDFVIIDFEGEPARSLEDRRKKLSALQDLAGMLRSFHYAAYAPLLGEARSRAENSSSLASWATYWRKWVSASFLRAYRTTCGDASFIPRSQEEFQLLLDTYILEKAVYEIAYELNNRPAWVRIPLDGILQVVKNFSSREK